MSLLQSIKAFKEPRELNFSFWRYRLLHWCFNEDAKTVADSKLPHYLYTHYCPLFHLTNFIGLFSPLILTIKVISKCWNTVGNISFTFAKTNLEDLTDEEKVMLEIQDMITILSRYPCLRLEFEVFWHEYEDNFTYLTRNVAKARYASLCSKISEQQETEIKNKKRRQDLILRLISVGQILVKSLIAISCAIFLGSMFFVLPAVFNWITTIVFPFLCDLDWAFVAKCTGVVIGGIAAIFTSLIASVMVFDSIAKKMHDLNRGLNNFCIGISPPFKLLGNVFVVKPALGGWFVATKGWDFIKSVYEKSCPPITIIEA